MGDLPELFEVLDKDDPIIQTHCPYFVVLIMDEGKPAPTNHHVKRMVARKNFHHVKCVYLLPPGQFQCYRAESLSKFCPHCQLTPQNVKTLIRNIHTENRSRTRWEEPPLEIIEVPPNEAFEDSFLGVAYATREDAIGAADPQDFLDVMRDVPKNVHRNNFSRHWGMKGWNSSERSPSSLGIAKPGCFRGTRDPQVQLMVRRLVGLLRKVLPGFSKDYRDPDRAKVFSATYMDPLKLRPDENMPDAITFVRNDLTDAEGKPCQAGLLGCHTDRNNDNITPGFEAVSAVSLLVRRVASRDLLRFGAVCYGKKAGTEHMVKLKKLGPVIEKCRATFRHLEWFQTSTDPNRLLPRRTIGRSDGRYHGRINLNKTFFYGMLADAIGKFMARHPQFKRNPDFLCALIWLSNISHLPQIFVQEISYLAETKDRRLRGGKQISSFKASEGLDFAVAMHKHLTDVKANRKHQCWDYSVSKRFQPCHNGFANKFQVVNSVRVLRLMIHCVASVKKNHLRDDPVFYHSRCNHRLSQSCDAKEQVTDMEKLVRQGCFGIGPFTANHIFMVAAYCGAIDPLLHNCTLIAGKTGIDETLVDSFGFAENGSDNHELLKCLTNYLPEHSREKLNMHESEELVCQTLRVEAGNHDGPTKPANKGWRFGDVLGLLERGKGRCVFRLRDNTEVLPPLLISLSDLFWKEAEAFPTALFWDVLKNERLPNRKYKGVRQVRQPVLADEIAVVKDDKNRLRVQAIHPAKLCMRGEAPVDAVLNFETLHKRRTVTVENGIVLEGGQRFGGNPNRKRRARARANALGEATEEEEESALLTDVIGAPSGNYTAYSVSLPLAGGETVAKIAEPAEDFPLRHDFPYRADTIVLSGTRFFLQDDQAKAFALLWALHTYPGRYVLTRFGRKFLKPPLPEDGSLLPLDGYENSQGKMVETKCGGRGGHRVDFCTYGISDSRFPHVVQVTHSTGSLMMYLCDDKWQCDSGVVVFPHRPTIPRNADSNVIPDVGVVGGIVSHRNRKCNEVRVGWGCDGKDSWEPLSVMIKGAPHQVRQYGRLMEMHGERGWTMVTNDHSHKSDFDGYPRFTVTYHYIGKK